MKKQLVVLLAFILAIASVFTVGPQKSEAATSDSIIAYAKKFEGTPYLFGGNTPEAFDCSGYILYVFKYFGITLPRTSESQFTVGTAVSRENLQAGDLVFFANTYKPGISHTGIYIGNGDFISAESGGVKISNLDKHPYWAPKYAGAKRIAGVSVTPPAKPVAPAPTPSKPAPPAPSKPAPAPVPSALFSDLTAQHPAYKAIETLSTQKVIGGYKDGSFQPETQVTRGQAATMVNRVLKLRPRFPLTYSDVPANHSFANDISAMSDAGILQGFEDGSFGMYDPLTKAQLAIILDRAFSMSQTASSMTKAPYADVPVTYRAAGAISALKKMDKTTVFQTTNFSISANATRAEFSAGLYSVANFR
ncbi:C40 family peptidase [Sporosarcina aquimarina]|uniref:NlpC/P60 family protein n=1 Tax=Sporosarcina aquimarina TaxID=114975 RepID=A0ABU4FVD5_9BACL|nr:NlpC/P60 family protein [Sporosarcina aquimarina]MDW0108688.1 NlpC/P60 family protein [Sporosarcina aquimarina]